MKAYNRPTCECNRALEYSGNAFVILDIKTDGTLSARRPYISPRQDAQLWCRDCKKYYKVAFDNKERIVRGEPM